MVRKYRREGEAAGHGASVLSVPLSPSPQRPPRGPRAASPCPRRGSHPGSASCGPGEEAPTPTPPAGASPGQSRVFRESRVRPGGGRNKPRVRPGSLAYFSSFNNNSFIKITEGEKRSPWPARTAPPQPPQQHHPSPRRTEEPGGLPGPSRPRSRLPPGHRAGKGEHNPGGVEPPKVPRARSS